MDHYQLRLPTEFGVRGLADTLASELNLGFGRLGLSWREDNPLSLTQAMGAILDRHLVVYDTCGSSCICDESVEPVAWNLNPDPRLVSSDPTRQASVLRVQFRFSAEEFYRFTAFLARVAASQSDVDDARAQFVQEELEKAVFVALSAFLFDAPMCHQRALCRDGQPLDLWGGDRPAAAVPS